MILSTPTDEIGIRKIAKKILNNKVLIVSVSNDSTQVTGIAQLITIREIFDSLPNSDNPPPSIAEAVRRYWYFENGAIPCGTEYAEVLFDQESSIERMESLNNMYDLKISFADIRSGLICQQFKQLPEKVDYAC